MLRLIRSGNVIVKAAVLIGVLIAASLTVFITQMEKTYASSQDQKICVTAVLVSDPTVSYRYGNCPDLETNSPIEPEPSATPMPSVIPTDASTIAPEPTVSEPIPTTLPQSSPTATSEPVISPSPTESPVESIAPSPTQSVTTSSPFPTETVTPQPTVEPSPSATTESVPDIPAENKDPSTKEFMFCHDGSMHSNSFTGMINGHHDRHPTDIIPPIPFKFYPGWNWNATNAKIFYNNCIPV